MKFFFTLLVFTMLVHDASAQIMRAEDFIEITSLQGKQFDNFISRKGFVQVNTYVSYSNVSQNYVYKGAEKTGEKKSKPDSVYRNLTGTTQDKSVSFLYSTSSAAEYKQLLSDMRADGFECDDEETDSVLFFQKNDITVQVNTELQDSLLIYQFKIDRQKLPQLASIQYAEDILDFDSHENLKHIFGSRHVKKDIYFFSAGETNRCSVLFPNTEKQMVFIWKDQKTSRKLSHILVGGNLRVKGSQEVYYKVGLNGWDFRCGLYPGMSLQELLMLNKSNFYIYNWQSNFAGMAIPAKTGVIDFEKTGVVLDCLNCHDIQLSNSEKISAEDLIKNSLQTFVLTVILMPDRKAGVPVADRPAE